MALSLNIESLISECNGLFLQSVKVLEGGYAILYFTKEEMDSTIKLWLSTPWRWESEENVLLAFDDTPEDIIARVDSFSGIQVERISVAEKTGDLLVLFRNNTWLNCPVFRREGDLWEIRWPNGKRCGIGENFRVETWSVDS